MHKINTKYCGLLINFATYIKQETVFQKLRTFHWPFDDATLTSDKDLKILAHPYIMVNFNYKVQNCKCSKIKYLEH